MTIAAILSATANNAGVGLTDDSYYYLDQAQELSQQGLTKYIQKHGFLQQLLVFVLRISLENYCIVLSVLNTLAFVGSVGLWIWISLDLFPDRSRHLIFAILMTFNTPFLLTASFLWTDVYLHLFTSLLFAIYLKCKVPLRRWLLYLPVFALMLFARKAGLLIMLGTVLVEMKIISTRYRWWSYILVFILIYLLYGYGFLPNYLGERPSLDFVPQNIEYQMITIFRWFLPIEGLFLAVVLVLFFVFLYFKGGFRPEWFALTIPSVYLLVRLFFEREFFEEHERYLSVMYPFFCMTIAGSISRPKDKIFYRITWIFIVIILFYNIVRSIKNVILWCDVSCS